MLESGLSRSGMAVDPLLLRALILALEGVTRLVLEEGDQGRRVTRAGIERVREVMVSLAAAALDRSPADDPICRRRTRDNRASPR